jgi:predicted HNH restriction endonuclease
MLENNMRYWVVKGRPREFSEDSYYKPGARGRWWTGKPPKDLARGDRLLFWKAAPSLRLVMLGKLVRVLKEKDEYGDTNFDVIYLTHLFENPISIAELRQSFAKNLPSFLKAGPSGTVFPLNHEQGEELFRIIVEHNPEISDVWSDIDHIEKEKRVGDLPDVDLISANVSVVEGGRRLITHLKIERDRKIVVAKKAQVLKNTGKLECEVCGFDYHRVYGKKLGYGFCEVHHKKSLSGNEEKVKTKLSDLAILCSNCHRMIHRNNPMLSIKALRKVLANET